MTLSKVAWGKDTMHHVAEGMTIIGPLNNCAGGRTPWGIYLMAEENFNGSFWTDTLDLDGNPDLTGLQGTDARSNMRYGVPGMWYAWGRHHDRFNIDKEPHEPNQLWLGGRGRSARPASDARQAHRPWSFPPREIRDNACRGRAAGGLFWR